MTTEQHSVDLTRHDISLLGIGLLLASGLLVGVLSTVALSRSLFAVSIPAVGCVGYTLFYRPPEAEPESSTKREEN